MKIRIYLSLFLLACSPFAGAQVIQAEQPTPEYVKEFSNLAKEKREEFGLHKSKAQQFFRQKRTFECLDQVYKANQIFEKDPSIWNLKGACYVEMRLFEKAREAYEEALSIDDRNTGVHFNLAEMDFVTKDWAEASEKFDQLMERMESQSDGPLEGPLLGLQRLALFKKMLSEYKLGNEEEAKQLAKENWEDFDDTPFTYYSKAALELFKGNEEEGKKWIQSAVRVFGGFEEVGNWQDTLIEIGLVKSFYGGDEGEEIPAAIE
jgi:tetratricopeptide (TPR) repeat protein